MATRNRAYGSESCGNDLHAAKLCRRLSVVHEANEKRRSPHPETIVVVKTFARGK